jgi:hypothetical protein
MDTMTLTEIITVVAAKLMYCFLLQITKQLSKNAHKGSALEFPSSTLPAGTSCVMYVTVDVFTVTGYVQ